jgi:endonuclease/exonuclease/phosphatase family metal-dependent hydrolase
MDQQFGGPAWDFHSPARLGGSTIMKSRWYLGMMMLALGLVVSGCAGFRAAKPETFRVMTYNIHHGEGLDGKVDLERIAALIRSEAADIVALQEVDKGVARTAGRDLGAELARLTGMQCVFSNNYHFQGGEYGNAVLTRFPVKQVTNHLFQMLAAREQRGLLQLVLDVHGREIAFWNTHLDAGSADAERWASISAILALAKSCDNMPFLLCGDFNDTPSSRVYQELAAHFDDIWSRVGKGAGATVPAAQPQRRIDYLWVGKNQQLTPKSAKVIHSEASDHLPAIAEIELPHTILQNN